MTLLLLPLPTGEGRGEGVLQDYAGPLRASFLHDVPFSAPRQGPLTPGLVRFTAQARRERET